MICLKCGHSHIHHFLTKDVVLSFCGKHLLKGDICTCQENMKAQIVEKRKEGEIIPMGYSLTLTPVAAYLRFQYENSTNNLVRETHRINRFYPNTEISVKEFVKGV